jgi:hypothetical protein
VLDTAHPHVVREVRERESVLDVTEPSASLSVGTRLQLVEEGVP